MTDSEFEDVADFDVNDVSSILKDIDNANGALDGLDARADKLRANIMSLLQAQSLANPYAHIEATPLEDENKDQENETTSTAKPNLSTLSVQDDAPHSNSSSVFVEAAATPRAPPNSVAPVHSTPADQ